MYFIRQKNLEYLSSITKEIKANNCQEEFNRLTFPKIFHKRRKQFPKQPLKKLYIWSKNL
jgi:hypothetical protein